MEPPFLGPGLQGGRSHLNSAAAARSLCRRQSLAGLLLSSAEQQRAPLQSFSRSGEPALSRWLQSALYWAQSLCWHRMGPLQDPGHGVLRGARQSRSGFFAREGTRGRREKDWAAGLHQGFPRRGHGFPL